MITNIESILEYLADLLAVDDHPDYGGAVNGLQVAGPREVGHLAAAVDASEEVIEAAVEVDADLLLVHHGIFWHGLRPLTGRRFRKVAALIRGEVGLYSAHLPLDGHETVGNSILLAGALGLDVKGRFGGYEGTEIGWWGRVDETTPAAFRDRVAREVDGPVRVLPGGEHPIRRVGVVTGGGGSFVEEAARRGLDALLTGEASHHTFADARELAVHVLLAGHYATETYGVKALAARLADDFGVTWEFLDFPSGL